jgi:Gpi18-like mannosyltransferase
MTQLPGKLTAPPLGVVFALGMLMAAVLRVALLTSPGMTADLDQFVIWAHGIATSPLGQAYDQDIAFPPVMVYVWWLLGVIEPALRTTVTSIDPIVRVVMKAPANLADLGIAVAIAWHLRSTPRWAVLGALGFAFSPAVLDVSSWWGQYESMYVLGGVIAFVLAVRGHSLLAAVAIGIAVSTKPQALVFVIPFGAWFLARDGWRGLLTAALAMAATVALSWVPFVAASGVERYAQNVAAYQDNAFAFVSFRAWNPWWLIEQLGGVNPLPDQTRILGIVTARNLGYLLAVVGECAVGWLVFRARSTRALALGLATAVLVAFTLLTTMHERYAFGALAFLPLALPDRRILWLWIAFTLVYTLNLLSAVPPQPFVATVLPVNGLIGIVGSIALTALTAWSAALLASIDDPPVRRPNPVWQPD